MYVRTIDVVTPANKKQFHFFVYSLRNRVEYLSSGRKQLLNNEKKEESETGSSSTTNQISTVVSRDDKETRSSQIVNRVYTNRVGQKKALGTFSFFAISLTKANDV